MDKLKILNKIADYIPLKNDVGEFKINGELPNATYEAEHIYDVQEKDEIPNKREELIGLINQERGESPEISKEKLTEMIHNELHGEEMLPALYN